MAEEGLTDADLARALGSSQSAVKKWRRGERVPRQDALGLIRAQTDGKVTANDFVPDDDAEAAS